MNASHLALLGHPGKQRVRAVLSCLVCLGFTSMACQNAAHPPPVPGRAAPEQVASEHAPSTAAEPSVAPHLARSGSEPIGPGSGAQAAGTEVEAPCGMPLALTEFGWPTKLEPTSATEPESFEKGSFTIAVLPDTQYYVSCASEHPREQAAWVAEQREQRNIVGAIQLGDLTEHNTPSEWTFIHDALQPASVLPLFLATGNHDYGDNGEANRRFTLFDTVFAEPAPATRKTVVAQMKSDSLENAFYELAIPGKNQKLGVLVLEWSPRTRTVQWANDVLLKHPRHRVIVVTHAYLFADGTRYDRSRQQPWNPHDYGTAFAPIEGVHDPAKLDESRASERLPHPEGAHDGEELWNALVRKHPGIFLTLNGHVLEDGTGYLESRGDHGNVVHQVLANYQMLDDGGLGYLRLLEFLPDGRSLRMKTYSPTLDRFATAEDQNFDVTLDPPLH